MLSSVYFPQNGWRSMFSSLQSTKKYFVIMFLISCVLLEVFTLVIYQQSKINRRSHDGVVHSYEVLRIARLTLADSIDMTSSEQDYILTWNTPYLDSYNAALSDLNSNVVILEKLINDNKAQRNNFAALQEKIDRLEKICATNIKIIHSGHINFYTLKNAALATRQALNDVRTAYDSFSQSESRLLGERMVAASSEQRNYILTLIMGAILFLGALVIANVVIFLLITKNTHAEEKLKKSEELFALILNGLNEGVYDWDIINDRTTFSPAYKAMLGYEVEELGKCLEDFWTFIHPDDLDPAIDFMNRHFNNEVSHYNNIFRIRHKDGHWVWVMSRGISLKDNENNVVPNHRHSYRHHSTKAARGGIALFHA